MLLITCALLFLAAGANAQLDCQANRIQAGMPYAAVEGTGQKFQHCDEQGNVWIKNCAEGNLFDQNKLICDYASRASVYSWPCDQARTGTRYPSECCRKYFRCTGSGFVHESCPEGQSFNPSTSSCDGTQCQDPEGKCGGPGGVGPGWVCPYTNVTNNPCQFKYNEITMLCPAGASWNQSLCQCGNHETACKETVGLAKNLVLDSQCRASFKTKFSATGISVVSEKIVDGQEYPMNIGWRLVGATYESGKVVLRTDAATSSPPQMFSWFFNSKEMVAPFVIETSFTFATAGTVANTFILLENNYMDACANNVTFRAEVTRTGGSVNLRVTATGISSGGVRIQGEASHTLNQSGTIKAVIAFNGALRACLGSGTGTPQCGRPSLNIGELIASNSCGWSFYRGFIGDVSQLTIYEGCNDFTRRGI